MVSPRSSVVYRIEDGWEGLGESFGVRLILGIRSLFRDPLSYPTRTYSGVKTW